MVIISDFTCSKVSDELVIVLVTKWVWLNISVGLLLLLATALAIIFSPIAKERLRQIGEALLWSCETFKQ